MLMAVITSVLAQNAKNIKINEVMTVNTSSIQDEFEGNWRWEGPLGTPLGLVHWKRASSPVEAGTAGYL